MILRAKISQNGKARPLPNFGKKGPVKIAPILLYGSELWGFVHRKSIELIHRYACKRYICVNLQSCNAAVLGDCGREP